MAGGSGVGSIRLHAARCVRSLAPALVTGLVLAGPAAASQTFTFAPDTRAPALPAGNQLVAVTDVNGDGVPDLMFEDQYGGTVGVMLGDGAGAFGALSSTSIGGGRPLGVNVADFNGDGHPDLLVGVETAPEPQQLGDEAFEVMLGNGSGGFGAGSVRPLKARGYVVAGDFNGDGREDVAEPPNCSVMLAGNPPYDNSTVYTFLGDGHGNLTQGPSVAASGSGCVWVTGDFNGDGRTDLATIPHTGPGEQPRAVVLPGAPNGGFGTADETTLPSGVSFERAGPVDLDGNHTLDLVAEGFGEPSTLYVLAGDGTGHFVTAGPYVSGGAHLFAGAVVGEFAGEGHPSILSVVPPAISVLEPAAGGALAPAALVPYNGPSNDAFVADVNRDGRNDLITADGGTLRILLDEPAVPVLAGARLSPRRWRDGTALATISRGAAHRGTTLSFSLNVAASVQLAFSERVVKRHRRRAATRWVSRGAVVLEAHAGADRVVFDGRLAPSRRLAPGAYRVRLLATDAGGSSKPVTLSFEIVR